MRRIVCEQCPVRETSICGEMLPAVLADFRACAVAVIYKPGQLLFHEGAAAAGFHVLCHGAAKLFQSDRFGRDYILDVARPGDLLGEAGLDEGAVYSSSAEAMVESQAAFVPREQFVRLLRLDPATGLRLAAALGRSLATARRKARDLVFKSAESRLAELLLGLVGHATEAASYEAASHGAASVTLACSRREIAEMIGVSPETAIRLLSALRDKHVLTLEHRDLIVHDLDRLRRIARD